MSTLKEVGDEIRQLAGVTASSQSRYLRDKGYPANVTLVERLPHQGGSIMPTIHYVQMMVGYIRTHLPLKREQEFIDKLREAMIGHLYEYNAVKAVLGLLRKLDADVEILFRHPSPRKWETDSQYQASRSLLLQTIAEEGLTLLLDDYAKRGFTRWTYASAYLKIDDTTIRQMSEGLRKWEPVVYERYLNTVRKSTSSVADKRKAALAPIASTMYMARFEKVTHILHHYEIDPLAGAAHRIESLFPEV